ncbi:unnamed protein product [Bursaphelenchus xylophilus]|uniref:(pine wood nematode) hypothetical protein n=1 Tax=Bursaphelenchus xylophilus TaxID=6326 RepID=A0A1I7S5N9_BURXY|nr:unnamed protein product [Bursaphelenchus xylophilus]CAG9124916.1 unnamed protein product [Bursaphelenchus xylophilus]
MNLLLISFATVIFGIECAECCTRTVPPSGVSGGGGGGGGSTGGGGTGNGGGGGVTTTAASPTTTTAAPQCAAAPAGSVAIVLVDVPLNDASPPGDPDNTCTCNEGTRYIATGVSEDNPDDAVGDNDQITNVVCNQPTDLCVCKNGNCCTVGATPPDNVNLIPRCENNVCSVYVVISGADDASLTCSGTTFTFAGAHASDGSSLPFSSGEYATADVVRCGGCPQQPTCHAAT